MAQPPAYNRDTDFARNAGSNTDHNALNAELDRASNSINDIRNNLAILQADDGRLRPAVVTSDSFSPELTETIIKNVTAGIQDDLNRAEAAADKSEAQASRAEGLAERADQKMKDAAAAAESASQSATSAGHAADMMLNAGIIPKYKAKGTPDALVVNMNEPLPCADMQPMIIRVPGLNTTEIPTIQLIGKSGTSFVYPIVKGIDTPLSPGDMTEDHVLIFNAGLGTDGKWVLMNPTTVSGTQAGGLPIGSVISWMGNNTPKDFLAFENQIICIHDYPELFEAVWCGPQYNLTADFFYRASDEAGTIRIETGDYMKMPDGSKYFVRGRDASGGNHPYQYQRDAFKSHLHVVGSSGSKKLSAGADYGYPDNWAPGQGIATTSDARPLDDVNVVNSAETRPMNFPVKWIIRANNSSVYQNGVDVVALNNKVDGLQALIESVANGTGVPVGSIIQWGGNPASIPPGYMNITTDTVQTVLVSTYPGFANAVWCGVDYNADADFFYRCDNVDGTGRNVSGAYIVLPMASKYFMRGRDVTGGNHPYHYQNWATENHRHDSTVYAYANPQAATNFAGQAVIGNSGTAITGRIYSGDGVKVGTETRPMNFPVLYLIKLFDAVYNPDMVSIPELVEQFSKQTVENKIINGDFRIDQEYGGTAVTLSTATTTLAYPSDQWRTGLSRPGTGSITAQTIVVSSSNHVGKLRITVPTGLASDHYAFTQQEVEGFNVNDLLQGTVSAKPYTLAFTVSAPAGKYCVVFKNALDTRAYIAEYEVSQTNVEQEVIMTIPGCVTGAWARSTSRGLLVGFTISAGNTSPLLTSSENANTWLSDSSATAFATVNQMDMSLSGGVFELSRVRLVAGTIAKPWSVPDYALELSKCKRYFQKHNINQTAIDQSNFTYWFPVQMRSMPTMKLTNAGGGDISASSASHTNFLLAVRNNTSPAWVVADATFNARIS